MTTRTGAGGAGRPLVVGHRGAAGLAPENTLAACAVALGLGVDAIEVDVRLSADGVPIVLHDATLERTTNGRGLVAGWPDARLARLDATVGFTGGGFAPEPPPPLAAVLELAQGRAQIHLELKGDPQVPRALVQAVGDLLRARGADDVLLLSFDWDALRLARCLIPGVPLCVLAAAWSEDAALARLRAEGVAWLGLRYAALTSKRVSAAHATGLRLGVWTVNTVPAMRRARRLGVDAITSDRPDRLLAALASA
jgi:glycerophosphoryl diester phosphodiesterase